VLTKDNYDTWLSPTHVVGDDDATLTIGVPKAFHKDWLENKLNGRIVNTMQRLGHGHLAVQYVVVPNGTATPAGQTSKRQREGSPAMSMSLFQHTPPSLKPDYVFETFIVGASNRFTHAAAEAVADEPGEVYNPLFIWGGVGLGKTHLLHAIGHKVRQNDPSKAIVYVTCEHFVNDMVEAIRTNQNQEFRARYRSADVLLIDDIQFLAGKESTQDEFFHTFNELHQNQKQIVLTSDRKPNAMSTLEERLRSRFEWGLITEVDLPDLETRVAILRAKAEKQKVPVPQAAIEYIARRAGQTNIRDLEGTLRKVIHMALTLGVPVTDKLAAEALDALSPSHKRKVTAAEVLDAVSQYYKLDMAAMTGPARDKGIALPRQVAMYLMREESDASLPGIGALLGNRDHSTVMHGCDKIGKQLRDENPQLRSDIRAIRAMLYEIN
jgi:chromosomal replication initiator protein